MKRKTFKAYGLPVFRVDAKLAPIGWFPMRVAIVEDCQYAGAVGFAVLVWNILSPFRISTLFRNKNDSKVDKFNLFVNEIKRMFEDFEHKI